MSSLARVPVRGLPWLFCFLLSSLRLFGGTTAQILWLSDLHFDPFANPSLVDKLAAAEPGEWEQILNSSSDQTLSDYGKDSNWPLFHSGLLAVRHLVPHPTLAIVTGDLLAHNFRASFDRTASVHDDAAYRAFFRKTIEFIGLEWKNLAPPGRFVIALGNNDSECGDYAIQPHGTFLEDTARTVADLAGLSGNDAFSKSWRSFGSFSLPNPVVQHHRIIDLNTTFWSAKYRNACGADPDRVGREMLSWLEAQLKQARNAHEKVWLVFHIPPGIDGYATSHSKPGVAPGAVVPFWKNAYRQAFDQLLAEYGDLVDASFAGHTHLDDFRLLDAGSPHPLVILMAPALDANARQNPAFRVISVRPNGTVADARTYFTDDLSQPRNHASSDWKLEYQFSTAWNLHGLDFDSYEKLWKRIGVSPQARKKWMLLYSVSHAETAISSESFPWLYCASGIQDENEYTSCVAEQKARWSIAK